MCSWLLGLARGTRSGALSKCATTFDHSNPIPQHPPGIISPFFGFSFPRKTKGCPRGVEQYPCSTPLQHKIPPLWFALNLIIITYHRRHAPSSSTVSPGSGPPVRSPEYPLLTHGGSYQTTIIISEVKSTIPRVIMAGLTSPRDPREGASIHARPTLPRTTPSRCTNH